MIVHILNQKIKELIHMKLKQFIELLQDEDPELDVLFDVKSFGQIDFGHLTDLYSDGEALILEFKRILPNIK